MIYKVVIAVVFVSCLSTQAYAQLETIEFFAGPSRTMSVGESNSSFESFSYYPIYSLSVGLGMRYKLNAHSGLAAKLLLEDRGSKGRFTAHFVTPGDPLIAQGTYKSNIKYFTFPILYSLRFGRKVEFVFDIGPNMAYQLTRSTNFGTGRSGSYHDDDRFQLGLTAGFGIEIPASKHLGITIGLLNNLGLYTIGSGAEPPYASVTNLLGGLRYHIRSKS